ncbi:MAG: spore coat associated protein CotJA [Vallitaleaceae bacterium]|nr:spore coat associated protein CotJA [Vallitaleaceae bacterium]
MLQKPIINMEPATGKMDNCYQLAHAYVPYQVLGEVYSPSEALCKGTLFPRLYMPYQYERS